jgi:hypothetical protein
MSPAVPYRHLHLIRQVPFPNYHNITGIPELRDSPYLKSMCGREVIVSALRFIF